MISNIFYASAGFGFFCALYPFTFYPFTIWLRNRVGQPSRPLAPQTVATFPDISIVFCAHNEARSIGSKLDNVSQLMTIYPGKSEAIVYLDGCIDETPQIALGHPAVTASRIQIIEGSLRVGKSEGMNAAVSRAKGEIIVFTDANVMLDEHCLQVAAAEFRDPKIGCLCGHLLYVNPNDSATAKVGSLYWRFEEWLKKQESMQGSTIGADGSLFALRRSLFRFVPADIIDDMYSSIGALVQGYRVVRSENFIAHEMHAVMSKDEFRRKVRIACRATNCLRFLWPQLAGIGVWNKYKVFGHKIMRWLTIFFLLFGSACLVTGLALDKRYGILEFLIGAILFFVLAARARIKLFSSVEEILLAFCATGIGLIESFEGKRYQTWNIAGSSRS